MARSKNGKLIGRASHAERQDLKEQLYREWEKSLPPNAVYWKNGALAAFHQISELMGRTKADEMTGDWDDGRSWKELCQQAEEIYWKLRFEELETPPLLEDR